MTTVDATSVRAFIDVHARPVDVAHVAVRLGDGDVETLLDELTAFQNPDGGFGHGLEPDFRARGSSPFTTSVALQYARGLEDVAHRPLVTAAVDYLRSSYRPDLPGWLAFDPALDISPSAPWWESTAPVEEWVDWGNPNAELLGYLLTFGDPDRDGSIVEAVTERTIRRLDEIAHTDPIEWHELICYRDLHDLAGDELRAAVWPRLSDLVTRVVDPDPASWANYSATPLIYVDGPDSPFVDLFAPELIAADLDRLVDGLVDGDHWEPNWTWGGLHPDTWPIARAEWIGVLAVRNLLTLTRFGRAT